MKYASLTDTGLRREKNQDSYCSIKNKYGDFLALVCDGIGGGKAGDVASGETVKFFINEFKKSGPFKSLDEIKDYLNSKITDINNEVNKLANKYREFNGMGTTLTGLLFSQFGTLSINIGDSRVYGINSKELKVLTRDHTLVNDMLDKGEITYEESLNHPKKHYLVRAIGVNSTVTADINEIQTFDHYIICSDGLYNCLDSASIMKIVNDKKTVLEKRTSNLIKKALLNGGYDNVTVIVIDTNE